VRAQVNLAHLYGAALAVLRAEPARRHRLTFLWTGPSCDPVGVGDLMALSAAQTAWPTEALEPSALALPTVGAARRRYFGWPSGFWRPRVDRFSGGPGT
jgi:hypothetical protein